MVIFTTMESIGTESKRIVYDYRDFRKIDSLAMTIPAEHTQSAKKLSDYIRTFAKSDIDFVRAMYVWYGSPTGMNYDFDYILKKKKRPSQQSNYALKTKIGVCAAYSNIMIDACAYAGIKAEYVLGKVYDLNQESNTELEYHAWVLVKVDGKYGLIDPTYGTVYGYKINEDSIRAFKCVNNAYFFFHPYENGHRREADNPIHNLRVLKDYKIKRLTLPTKLESIIAQYPTFRKVLDNVIGASLPLYQVNMEVVKQADILYDDPDEKASYFWRGFKSLDREYFVVNNNHIEISFSGLQINLISSKGRTTKNIGQIQLADINKYPYLTKQLMFFVEDPEIEDNLFIK